MNPNRRDLATPNRFDGLALITSLLLALAFRLPGLTRFLTADEPRSWLGRSIIFLVTFSDPAIFRYHNVAKSDRQFIPIGFFS